MNTDKIIKLFIILFIIYGGLFFVDKYDYKIIEKTLLLTVLITFVNAYYPTL